MRIVHRTPLVVIRYFQVNAVPATKIFPTAGKVDLSRFITALTSFQLSACPWLYVLASLTTPEITGFSMTISGTSASGSSDGLESASGACINLDKCAVDMQCGMSSARVAKGSSQSKIFVSFPMKYDETPQVLLWLGGLQMSCIADNAIEVEVEDPCPEGFTLQVTTPGSSVTSANISWLAYPVQKPGVIIGTFRVEATGCVGLGRKDSGYVAFPPGWFKELPRVAVAITSVGVHGGCGVSLSVKVVNVTSEGMEWRMIAHRKGTYKSAVASFIAVE